MVLWRMFTVIVQPRFKVVLGFHGGWGSYAFSEYDEVETLIQDLLNLFFFLKFQYILQYQLQHCYKCLYAEYSFL